MKLRNKVKLLFCFFYLIANIQYVFAYQVMKQNGNDSQIHFFKDTMKRDNLDYWNGFYLGGILNYSVSQFSLKNVKLFNAPNSFEFLLGYNSQVNIFVLGLETNVSFLNDSDNFFSFHLNKFRVNLKPRLGFDLGPFLPFVSAGISVNNTEFIDSLFFRGSYSLGLDYKLMRFFLLRFELEHLSKPIIPSDLSFVQKIFPEKNTFKTGIIWRF